MVAKACRIHDGRLLTSPRIMPWLTRRWNGSLVVTTPMSYKTLCQNLQGDETCLSTDSQQSKLDAKSVLRNFQTSFCTKAVAGCWQFSETVVCLQKSAHHICRDCALVMGATVQPTSESLKKEQYNTLRTTDGGQHAQLLLQHNKTSARSL